MSIFSDAFDSVARDLGISKNQSFQANVRALVEDVQKIDKKPDVQPANDLPLFQKQVNQSIQVIKKPETHGMLLIALGVGVWYFFLRGKK